MLTAFVNTCITFSSHIFAATHLAQLRLSKRKTYALWGVIALPMLIASCFLAPTQLRGGSIGFTTFSVTCTIHIGLYFFTTKGRISERFFLIVSYATFFTACCALSQFMQVFALPEGEWWHSGVYAVLLALMQYVFIGKLLPVFRESARYIVRGWGLLCTLMGVFMLGLIITFVYPNNVGDYTRRQAAVIPAIVVMLFLTYAVMFVYIRNVAAAQRAKQIEMRLELLTAQVDAQANLASEARRARHDLRHHNLALLALAEQDKSDEIARYLRGMTDCDGEIVEKAWCGNSTLNSILSAYEQIASDARVDTDILAQTDKDIPIAPEDLVCAVANLFENAIHGAALSEAAEKGVKIRIRRRADKLVVYAQNPCSLKFDFPDGFPVERYGVGLMSVSQVVNKYDGEMNLSAEGGVFTAIIFLNLP